MKKRNEILDLSVICIDEGVEYGHVKELIIDPKEGRVVYLIIDDGDWYLGAKILEFNDILGIGKDAITTQTSQSIKKIREDDEVLELVKRGIKIISSKAYSQSGEYIGLIEEIYIDEDNGSIIKCILDREDVEIPASSIITYGREVVIVRDELKENILKGNDERVGTLNLEELGEDSDNGPTNIFEERQKRFVLGRRATKTIKDKDGQPIVLAGQIIDESMVKEVSTAGKLVELTMNIE